MAVIRIEDRQGGSEGYTGDSKWSVGSNNWGRVGNWASGFTKKRSETDQRREARFLHQAVWAVETQSPLCLVGILPGRSCLNSGLQAGKTCTFGSRFCTLLDRPGLSPP